MAPGAEFTGHQARKRFGQNFLTDPTVTARIAALIKPEPQDHMVEIGPGRGALTERLVGRCAQLDLIELDRDLAAALTRRYADCPGLTVHSADALRFDFAALGDSALRVVGNLPYNVATPILLRLLHSRIQWSDMVFMLQKEVADRLAAAPSSHDYGRLSVMTQAYASVRPGFIVKPGAFNPVPKIDSRIVSISPLPDSARLTPNIQTRLEVIVRTAFGQRRKMIAKSLRGSVPPALLEACGVRPDQRPETVSVPQFIALATAVENAMPPSF